MNNYILNICGEEYLSTIDDSKVKVNNSVFENVELVQLDANNYVLKNSKHTIDAMVEKLDANNYRITIEGMSYEITIRTELEHKAYQLMENSAKYSHSGKVKAPMPGLILAIKVKVGDKIEIGDSLLIFEAMKMENDLKAEFSGTVKEIHVQQGTSVEKNQLLITVE